MDEHHAEDTEKSIRDLHRYANFKRFRTRAFILLMTTSHNTGVFGRFDLEGAVAQARDELIAKYKRDLPEKL
jgi:hypothetical protein